MNFRFFPFAVLTMIAAAAPASRNDSQLSANHIETLRAVGHPLPKHCRASIQVDQLGPKTRIQNRDSVNRLLKSCDFGSESISKLEDICPSNSTPFEVDAQESYELKTKIAAIRQNRYVGATKYEDYSSTGSSHGANSSSCLIIDAERKALLDLSQSLSSEGRNRLSQKLHSPSVTVSAHNICLEPEGVRFHFNGDELSSGYAGGERNLTVSKTDLGSYFAKTSEAMKLF